MSTSATLQHTIQIRPSRFVGLLVAVVALTSVTTWAVDNVTTSTNSGKPAASSAHVDGVTALSPAVQAATYGNVPTQAQRAAAVSRLSPTEQAAIFGNVSPARHYLDGISHLSPAQLAAIYGNVPLGSTP